MAMTLGVVMFLLGLAKDVSTAASSSRSIRAVPGPDCYMSSEPACSLKYDSVGCYKTKRSLTELLLTAKDPKSKVYFGQKIAWLKWANFIDGFTCACAMKAKQKNYDYFGIENYGECWGGMKISYVSSGNCKMVKANECLFEACNELRNDSRLCVGAPMSQYVYRIEQEQPSTMPPSTQPPTQGPSTLSNSTQPPTQGPSTVPPSTQPPTQGPSTAPPSTQPPTQGPSTVPRSTQPPTQGPTTAPPSTQPPTQGPSTAPPSTQPPTQETPTVPPVTQPPTTALPPQTPSPPPPTQAPTTAEPTTPSDEDNCEE